MVPKVPRNEPPRISGSFGGSQVPLSQDYLHSGWTYAAARYSNLTVHLMASPFAPAWTHETVNLLMRSLRLMVVMLKDVVMLATMRWGLFQQTWFTNLHWTPHGFLMGTSQFNPVHVR
jgi:hypothetical protein